MTTYRIIKNDDGDFFLQEKYKYLFIFSAWNTLSSYGKPDFITDEQVIAILRNRLSLIIKARKDSGIKWQDKL